MRIVRRLTEFTRRGLTSSADGGYLRDLFDLTGSVAFVTGGSRGIGRETCLTLARSGADVLVTDYDEEGTNRRCRELVQEIRNLGRRAASCVCDVRFPESVKEAVTKCTDELGALDILVANAGIAGGKTIPDQVDENEWRNVFATNVEGVFHCCRFVYPVMKEQGKGKVIIMSSASSMVGMHTQAAFTSSKGAVIPYAKSLAVAWAKNNIQVNCILPGLVDTEFNLEFMASDYITGAQLVIDGGFSINRTY